MVPEREVAVCSADEGQQARNSCPELQIFFLLASHGLIPSCTCTVCIAVDVSMAEQLQQYEVELKTRAVSLSAVGGDKVRPVVLWSAHFTTV